MTSPNQDFSVTHGMIHLIQSLDHLKKSRAKVGTRNERDDKTYGSILSQIEGLIPHISSPVVNRISENHRFKKLFDESSSARGLLDRAIKEANERIKDAKKQDTKGNRELEKKKVIDFFSRPTIMKTIDNLYQLKELFAQAKGYIR